MGKIKTLRRRKASSKKLLDVDIDKVPGISRENPIEYLTNENNIGLAILECLQNNDPEGVMEVIGIYMNAMNKAKLREKSHLSKSTMYHSLKSKNPTIKTLAKVVSAISN